MANVEEARKKFFEAKAAVSDCQSSIQKLLSKADQLQESLPNLSRAVEAAEKEKQVALDNFAMTSNKQAESELRKARTACEQVARQRIETNELIEATARALKKQESEFVRLNNVNELTKRRCWQAVADEIKSAISSEVFESVRRLQVIGSQTSQTRQWILDSLFPSPSTHEFQEIRSELVGKYGIGE